MMRTLILAAGLCAFASAASAQDAGPLPLTNMNFDLWCQEEQHLPPERCDKRLPADNDAFEAYRAKIENYEIPYLQRKQQEQNFNRVILHNDPVDHPVEPNAPQTQRPERDNESGN
jgi:hypothetical protein